VALDFIPTRPTGFGFALGVTGQVRSSRARQIKDPVVESLGKLDYAIEVGPRVGISIPHVLNAYDGLSLDVDAAWDINGAHGGMVVEPSITYFTPLSRGIAASLSLSAEHGDGKFLDYYHSVTPAQSVASGLPAFDPDGGGWTKAGGNLLLGFDLDGNLENGGLALVVIGGYMRMLGDAKRSPFTSVRGDADQWTGALGLGFTF
jgi:outer membrane scaffolding protein for murein synthesis (MipA/OmpV family)